MSDNIYTVFSRSATNFEEFTSANKHVVAEDLTIEEARQMCVDFNNHRNSEQVRKGTKYEFTSGGI